ncbi:MAG: ATP-binding cassette domain-containing protein [Deltaproteobacteria bacterium]|nr:ATP-binding cassette domain-containing protein [Deltaproteobacteria bacterium]
MITIQNITKSFGGNILFKDAGFKLNRKERIGLVGRNGHGKTTLFNIIAGYETQDKGNIKIPKNYRIGYVRQQIDFKEDTILKEGIIGLNHNEKDSVWKVEKILTGLGFSQRDFNKSPYKFSGGFQIRLNLAKTLLSEPDLLLLDEPTNYLDITSIRWIEKFLNNWPRELILITHDRSFMDKVITCTVGIHRKKMRKIQGNTEKYYYQIAAEEEIYEKTRQNDERKRQEIQLFITRFRAKARLGGLVQSRVKTLEKQDKKDKLESITTLEFSFREKPVKCRYVIRAENISFGYDKNNPLIKNLDFSLTPNEKICIVGGNGKGKTTLLKILAKVLKQQEGKMTYNSNAQIGFYEQTNILSLNPERSVMEEILYADKETDQQIARNIAGAMMFEQDAALKKIRILSGGEKARVILGKLLVTPLNLLLLDEPTNHLDMDSAGALLAALDDFNGAVIMATHNEMFLNAIAQKLIVFRDEKVFLFNGTYADFLEKGGWNDEETGGEKANFKKITETQTEKIGKKELRKLRSDILAEKIETTKPIQKKIALLEEEINTAEKKIALINNQIIEASKKGEGPKLAKLSQETGLCRQIIDAQFKEYEQSTYRLEKAEEKYTKRLAELEGL